MLTVLVGLEELKLVGLLRSFCWLKLMFSEAKLDWQIFNLSNLITFSLSSNVTLFRI